MKDNNLSEIELKDKDDNSGISKQNTQAEPQIITSILDYLSNQSLKIEDQDAANAIVYGMQCHQIVNGNKIKVAIFQQEPIVTVITIIDIPKEFISKIDLSHAHISFDNQSENFQGYSSESVAKGKVVNLIDNKYHWDLVFDSELDLVTFLSGILRLFAFFSKFDSNSIAAQIKRIWNVYDKDFSKTMEKSEFKKFTNDLNMAFNKQLDFEDTFKRIDANNNGSIDFDEFVAFYAAYTDGHEYSEIFNKYKQIEKRTMLSVEQLQTFFKEVQKEEISRVNAQSIIISNKQSLSKTEKEDLIEKVEKKLPLNKDEEYLINMTLEEFKSMINSPISNVLNNNGLNGACNINRPLNDYFINSTHNTYLTGHQLTGDSKADMYGYSVREGYRLVELDCYNGSGDEIVITHGYTFTTKVKLKDVLTQLKKHSFRKSSYPVILSIENHLDKEHQAIMTRLFHEILVDLYIFPQDDSPQQLPPLHEMKNKFIIKCGGKRIQKDRTKLPPRSLIKYEPIIDEDIYKKSSTMKSEDKVEQCSFIDNIAKSKGPNKNLKDMFDKEKYKAAKKNTETTEVLDKVRGLLGTKFSYDKITENNYQPWEMVTIKAEKVIGFSSEYSKRKTIISFTQNSLMKAYPTGFDSSNYDPIKCWIVGCQVAAFNVQSTEDDWTLLNMIFFKNNKNRGYVLKPPKLLPESTIIESYEKPYGKVTIFLYTMIGLNNILAHEGIVKEKKEKIRLECNIVGSNEDDKKNKKFTSNITGDFLLPKIEGTEMISFDIYEKDLSCIYFRLYYDKDKIGRSVLPLMMMKEGVRRIEMYDSKCLPIQDSYIFALIKKTF